MVKRSKKYREAAEKVDRNNLYTANEAIALLEQVHAGLQLRPDLVEAVYRLSVDPRKADQLVRGTVNLPHGTGSARQGRRVRPWPEGHRGCRGRRRHRR